MNKLTSLANLASPFALRSAARTAALVFGLLPPAAVLATGCVAASDSDSSGAEPVDSDQSELLEKTINIDFGTPSVAVPSGWNDAQSFVKSGKMQLKDSTNAATTYAFAVTKPWNKTQPFGTLTAAARLGLPVAATEDGVYGNVLPYEGFSAPYAEMKVEGLNPAVYYGFHFFASVKKHDGYNRDTLYRVIGHTTATGNLNATNNDTKTVDIWVKPDADGTVTLRVEKGAANNTTSGFYHLANLKITYGLPLYGTQKLVPLGSAQQPPNGHTEYLPSGYRASDTATKWPLLISLHGIGEVGNGTSDLGKLTSSKWSGLPGLIQAGLFPAQDRFVVLAPQHGNTAVMPPAELKRFVAYAVAHYNVDPKRMYLTGLSLGGRAVWDYVNTYGAATEFAAVSVMPGDGAYDNPMDCTKVGRVPMWAFQGGSDTNPFTNPTHVINAWHAVNACKTAPVEPSKLTIYSGVGHNCWSETYDLSGMQSSLWAGYSAYDEDVYSWMLAHEKP